MSIYKIRHRMVLWGRRVDTVRQLKPDYNSEAVQLDLIKQVCSYFGRVFDDEEQEKHKKLRGHRPEDDAWKKIMFGKPTVNQTAEKFHITPQKVKKLLITGGCYDTSLFRTIRDMREQGMSVEEISQQLGIRAVTVRSYLPYERVIYNLEERSVTADRLQRFKERHGGYRAQRER